MVRKEGGWTARMKRHEPRATLIAKHLHSDSVAVPEDLPGIGVGRAWLVLGPTSLLPVPFLQVTGLQGLGVPSVARTEGRAEAMSWAGMFSSFHQVLEGDTKLCFYLLTFQ